MGALAGRVVLVTGSSRGIGRGCAVELGRAGATVYVTGRTVEPRRSLPGTVGATADEVGEAGGRGIAVECDHRDDAAVAALFARIEDEQGRLDVLVNNAFKIPRELTSGRSFFELPISNWDDMIGVGTRSAYVASWHAVPLMQHAGRGLIVNISSSGAREYAWHVAYGVGKAALDRFTADAAHELRAHHIAVVSLWPGLVRTERNEGAAEAGPALDWSGAESLYFTGRAAAALASDARVMERSGRAWTSRELADAYGFTDVDGALPVGPLEHRPGGVG
jgi:dehydrogenase/reductase SDR family protein 1